LGAAELAPPASGRIALFSTAIEFDVFSSPLPEVAAPVVVQLVSGFWLEGVVDCANAGPTTNVPTRIAAAVRIMLISCSRKRLFQIWKMERPERTMVPRAGAIEMVERATPVMIARKSRAHFVSTQINLTDTPWARTVKPVAPSDDRQMTGIERDWRYCIQWVVRYALARAPSVRFAEPPRLSA
jgi:hypothetical protein